MRLDIDSRSIQLTDRAPQEEWPAAIGRDRSVPLHTLKDNDLFLITDTLGNFSAEPQGNSQLSMGLFCRDTRYLSRLDLQIEGLSPLLLSSNADAGSSLTVLCTNPDLGSLPDQPELPRIPAETLGIRREIALQGGLFEEIHVTNYHLQTATFSLSLSLGADFFDLFEVRGWKRDRRGQLFYPITQDEANSTDTSQLIVLAYEGLDGLTRSSWVQFEGHPPHYCQGSTAVWDLTLEPQASITLTYRVQLFAGDRPASAVPAPLTLPQSRASERLEREEWQDQIPQIRTDNQALNRLLQRGIQDLHLLRQTVEDRTVLAAGVPWFSTLFGRDALIAASQTLLLDPRIARDTLLILAQYQGQTDDEWRDEEPGKIMHEIRYGEMARCREVPHTPYYGTVDATPLWLLLYAEYWAWTAHGELSDRLWPHALAAMDWVDRQCEATGYLAYHCRSKRGLVNQGWKDSGNCIVDRQGQLATGSIALAEVQGYVYAAKMRLSDMARSRQKHELADRWQTQARDLKTRFNRDFWMPDEDFCALALDGDGKRVDSITSNPGQCLQYDLLDADKAEQVAERLRAADLYSGWGIRTLSSRSPAYNPMGYHTGSVWPHDNGLIGLGLRAVGRVDQALEVAQGLIDMTLAQTTLRPPELFCGYDRQLNPAPVLYPVACSPQAWATGSLFHLLRIMVNLTPDAPNNRLQITAPALFKGLNHLSIQNLRVGQTLLNLELGRSGEGTSCSVSNKRGNLRVTVET